MRASARPALLHLRWKARRGPAHVRGGSEAPGGARGEELLPRRLQRSGGERRPKKFCAVWAMQAAPPADGACTRTHLIPQFVITELVAQRREVGRVEDAESSSSRLLQSLLPLLDKRVSQALLVKILFLVADIAASSSLPASNLQAGVRALLRLLQNQVEGAAAPATLPATLAALLKLSAHDDLSRVSRVDHISFPCSARC